MNLDKIWKSLTWWTGGTHNPSTAVKLAEILALVSSVAIGIFCAAYLLWRAVCEIAGV